MISEACLPRATRFMELGTKGIARWARDRMAAMR